MGVPAKAHDGDFAFYMADIIVESVQYGDKTGLCGIIPGIWDLFQKSDPESTYQGLSQLHDFGITKGVTFSDYDRNFIKNTTISDSAARSWTYQYCTEFGWFQTPSS